MPRPSTKRPVILPTQARSRHTFEAIIGATAYLIRKHGVQDITSNDIAERAGVNINSFYQYFLDKKAAVRVVAQRHLAENMACFKDVCERAKALESNRGFAFIVDEMLKLFIAKGDLRRQLLFHMPLLVGPAHQHAVRSATAAGLVEFIPKRLHPTRKQHEVAARMFVHTFIEASNMLLDPALPDAERALLQSEFKKLLFRYVGYDEADVNVMSEVSPRRGSTGT